MNLLEYLEKYAPLLDRLEHEIEMLQRDDPISRARMHLAKMAKLKETA